jgi:hypothetical protein
MPRAKGKANYKVETLIQVVEEKLPNGAQGWIEVAALYQHCSGELILRDHEDVKQHWIEKCCNKFKKPTGNPGDPKRDMILRCQRIQGRIHEKSSSLIMGVDSGGDDGLSVEDEESSLEEDDEEEELALLGGSNGVDFVEAAGDVSRGETPVVVDGSRVVVDGGSGYDEVVPRLPPFITQQSAGELAVGSARLEPTPQPQQMFTPRPPLAPQQLAPHLLQTVQSHVGQPAPGQLGQQTSVAKAKKARKSVEPSLSSEKTKNSSLSEKRGSIVKSIDKLASSISADEANTAAAASTSGGIMPMMLMMQMQQQQQYQQQMQQQQQQYQQQMQQQQMMQQQAFMQSQMEVQLKAMQDRLFKKLKKDKKKQKKRAKKKRKAANVVDGDAMDSSSSSSSSSSEST